MITKRTSTVLMLALAALAGCTTVRGRVTPGANLMQYKTYGWYTTPTATQRQRAFEASPAGDTVRLRIAANLADRGIRETNDNPDFLVAFHTKLEQKLDVNDWGYPGLFWGAQPGPVSIDEYTAGTLLVDFIDPRTGQIFWRGTANAIVGQPESPNLNKLSSTVDKIMKKYPAQVASVPRQAM